MAVIGANPKGIPREIRPGVRVYPDAAELARGAARLFVDYAWQSIARQGQFMVALSGGNTPRAFFGLMASAEFKGQVDWPKVHFFWADERAVPPTHPDSNYGTARRELFLRVGIPEKNIHRMEAEKPNIGRAAHDYEGVLREYLERDDGGFPRFHLILLGIGADGHTASLFPGGRVVLQTSRWVSTPAVAKSGARRMTLTLPVLNSADRVVFLVSGAGKAEILREVVERRTEPVVPACLVEPKRGLKLFLADQAAAALLTPVPPPDPAPPAGAPAARRKKPGEKA